MSMKIDTQIKIVASTDNCIVSRTGSDRINVGSITLKRDEVEDFCDSLRQVLVGMTPPKPPTPQGLARALANADQGF